MPKFSSQGRVWAYEAFLRGYVVRFFCVLEDSGPWCESRTCPVGLAPVIELRRLRRKADRNKECAFANQSRSPSHAHMSASPEADLPVKRRMDEVKEAVYALDPVQVQVAKQQAAIDRAQKQVDVKRNAVQSASEITRSRKLTCASCRSQQQLEISEHHELVLASPLPPNKRCALGDVTPVGRSAQDDEDDLTMEHLADPSRPSLARACTVGDSRLIAGMKQSLVQVAPSHQHSIRACTRK